MQHEYLYEGKSYTVGVEKKEDIYRVTVGDRVHEVNVHPLAPGVISMIIDGRSVLAHTAEDEQGRIVCIRGVSYHLTDPALEAAAADAGEAHQAGNGTISTPMPGKIVEVHVKEGDAVEKGQALLILESMKMQNDITSDVTGTVKKIHFKAGDQAAFGEPLVEIEVEE